MKDKESLLRKLGYSLCADGLGDMNGLELYHSWQNGAPELAHLTLEDAEIAIEAAYDELNVFRVKMLKKSKGWEVLKRG